MASGFVQRWKGKADFDPSCLWVAGQPIYGPTASASVVLVSSSLGASTLNGSFNNLLSSASTTQSIVRLRKPMYAGSQMTVQVSTASGLGIILTASTDGSITFNGSSLSVAKSTGSIVQTLELNATSTANWAITGAYPGIATSTGGVVWTLSTSS
jgi:hypothetical protein